MASILSEVSKPEVKYSERGEELGAPASSGPLNSDEAGTFWYCSNCDCMFEAPYPRFRNLSSSETLVLNHRITIS